MACSTAAFRNNLPTFVETNYKNYTKMTFETGKKYEFKRNEFDISKETGRLYFVIKDPAEDINYRIKPFDFQTRELPEKIVCYLSSAGRVSQDVYSVVPLLYNVEIGRAHV